MVTGGIGLLENDEELNVPDVPLARIDDEEIDDILQISENSTSFKDLMNNLNEKKSTNHLKDLITKNYVYQKNENDLSNLSNSLENLVETFDQKISTVLKNFGEETAQIAPIQVQVHSDLVMESQLWWTLTGNYGSILPLDFNKTNIRKKQLKALNLHSPKSNETSQSVDTGYECEVEDEEIDELREAFDFHQLMMEQGYIDSHNPPISAEQVIEEIDEIMQTCDIMSGITDRTNDGCSEDSMYSSIKSPFTTISSQTTDLYFKNKHTEELLLTKNELNSLPQSKLLTIVNELEQLIQIYNMDLVNELAQRAELEYEKEVKNKFITLLVNIQEQKRKILIDVKKKKNLTKAVTSSALATTSIPYNESQMIENVQIFENLTKILQAISDDSPSLPSLLTEYILTVVCPSTTNSISV